MQDNRKTSHHVSASEIGRSLKIHILTGSVIIALLIGGLGGWMAMASISGAVVASGTVVVENNIKRVQHREGGIVGEILIKEGDEVEAGSLLIRLDATLTRANLAIITQQIDGFSVRQARLEAQQGGYLAIFFPKDLMARRHEEEIAKMIKGETTLFAALIDTMANQKAQLKERVEQLNEETGGLSAQRTSILKQSNIIASEIVDLTDLLEKGYVPKTRLLALQREAARLEGENGQLVSDIARTRGRIVETKLQLSQLDQNMHAEVAKELRDVHIQLSELAERRVAAEDQLKRVNIRASRSGFVHQLAIHTIGGVIAGGETIMMIVPRESNLNIEVQVMPTDIDQLYIGQPVALKFPSFNQRTTPELDGFISIIAADLTRDDITAEQFYVVRINLAAKEVTKLGSLSLRPGMPVEAFVQTDERTALSYLIKPISDQITRAFRED